MKRFVKSVSIATLMVAAASGTVLAGDYNSGILSKTPGEEFTNVEFGSGWYLRGDLGYNIRGRTDRTVVNVPAIGFSTQADYDDQMSFRVGAGYYIAPNIRLEANLEGLMDSSFSGISATTFAASDTVDPLIVTTGGTVEVDAAYSISDFLFGANVDLGTFHGFTPYVGAAVGVGLLSYEQTNTFTCVPGAATTSCLNPAGAAGATVTSTTEFRSDDWTHAYQFTVGGAYRVDERTSVDVSYSLTQIGDGDEISYADGTAIDPDGVLLHQVRAGLRYELW